MHQPKFTSPTRTTREVNTPLLRQFATKRTKTIRLRTAELHRQNRRTQKDQQARPAVSPTEL